MLHATTLPDTFGFLSSASRHKSFLNLVLPCASSYALRWETLRETSPSAGGKSSAPDIELVGESRNESDLADIVEQVQPDVLIIAMNETEKRLGQCGFLLGRHPEMRPAKRGKHLPPILSTAKQTPAPKTSAQRLLPDSPGNNY